MIKKNNNKPKEQFNDLGLGTKINARGQRMIRQDGSFNIERRGLPRFTFDGLYNEFITMSWFRFNVIIIVSYAAINILFALLYFACGTSHFDGIRANNTLGRFLEMLYFSAQTFTTVGYGRVNPVTNCSGVISSVESLIGLLSFALATGLLYGRFSRPQANILFSKVAVIAPYKDITAFMFRLANKRRNQLIEIQASLAFSKIVMENGQAKRHFFPLELERTMINFLPSSWTIVHPITENSPFYNVTSQELIDTETEITILLKAFDDTFSQTVHARYSFRADEIIFGARFTIIFGVNDDGITYIDLHRIDEVENVELPVLA